MPDSAAQLGESALHAGGHIVARDLVAGELDRHD
jgi:hypothetical protein